MVYTEIGGGGGPPWWRREGQVDPVRVSGTLVGQRTCDLGGAHALHYYKYSLTIKPE